MIILCTFLLCFLNCSFTNPATNTIEQFGWLVGSWQGKTGNGEMHEYWRKHDEQTLVGEGYFIVKGDTVLREILRIQRIGNFWTYIPVVGKQEPVLFTLKKTENNTWFFENREHDFPQRIVYQRQANNTLLAYIEGTRQGKTVKEEYQLQKMR
ncbi:MAG TPA: DUF6265 family protein [Adhaeribacter sp.]|nr:DUF6265 family protein [Adhaeribacter sp.]